MSAEDWPHYRPTFASSGQVHTTRQCPCSSQHGWGEQGEWAGVRGLRRGLRSGAGRGLGSPTFLQRRVPPGPPVGGDWGEELFRVVSGAGLGRAGGGCLRAPRGLAKDRGGRQRACGCESTFREPVAPPPHVPPGASPQPPGGGQGPLPTMSPPLPPTCGGAVGGGGRPRGWVLCLCAFCVFLKRLCSCA